jgi:tetratricopeptide (TPR) repeat protein
MKSILAAFAVLLFLAAGAAHGQHTLGMHTHAGTGGYSACVDGRFNGPIELYPTSKAGNLNHQPLSTDIDDARRYFNQGLTFVYGFDSESAMRSFYQASVKDSTLAMAYWGIALAAGGDLNIPIDDPCAKLAREQIQIAFKKSPKGPEKLYIEALAKHYAIGGDPQRYVEDMKSVYQQLGSQDPDAAGLYVYSLMNVHPWKWWPPSCQSTDSCQPTEEIAEALRVLQGKLSAFPGHIGLRHLYIHAMEEGPIKRAVETKASADFLHKNAPLITPHLRHMPAHTYLLLGNWQGVIAANQGAVDADAPWVEACKASPSAPECNQEPLAPAPRCNELLVGHYYSHDLLFLSVGYNNRGEWDPVQRISTCLENNVRRFVDTQPGLEHYLTTKVMMMVHFGQWQMLKDLPPPQKNMPSFESPTYCADLSYKLAAAMWYFGRAMGRASLKESTDDDVRGFDLAQGCVRSAKLGWGNNLAADVLKVVAARLRERMARMKGLKEDSQMFALRAVEAEDLLGYDEPPGWYLSSRETYGAALYLAEKYQAAEAVFRADQERRPNNSRSLFGLWQALEKQPGKASEAAKAKADFKSQWVGPEPTMENL